MENNKFKSMGEKSKKFSEEFFWDKQIKKQITVNNKVDITKEILEAINE